MSNLYDVVYMPEKDAWLVQFERGCSGSHAWQIEIPVGFEYDDDSPELVWAEVTSHKSRAPAVDEIKQALKMLRSHHNSDAIDRLRKQYFDPERADLTTYKSAEEPADWHLVTNGFVIEYFWDLALPKQHDPDHAMWDMLYNFTESTVMQGNSCSIHLLKKALEEGIEKVNGKGEIVYFKSDNEQARFEKPAKGKAPLEIAEVYLPNAAEVSGWYNAVFLLNLIRPYNGHVEFGFRATSITRAFHLSSEIYKLWLAGVHR